MEYNSHFKIFKKLNFLNVSKHLFFSLEDATLTVNKQL